MTSPIVLAAHAREEGTYVITVSFKDEAGTPVIPGAAAWTLTSTDGTVINGRQDVAIAPATSVAIVLSGDDLVVGSYGTTRLVLVEYTYTSSYGSNLPDKVQIQFEIDDLVGVV